MWYKQSAEACHTQQYHQSENDVQPSVSFSHNKSCFGGNYQSFSSIDSSVKAYIKYIKTNFYDKELTTPGAMYKAYNKDVRWVFRVNNIMDNIKNS